MTVTVPTTGDEITTFLHTTVANRFYFELYYCSETSEDFIQGYIGDTEVDLSDVAQINSCAFNIRQLSGEPWVTPIASYRTNISAEDLSYVTTQGNNWTQWIINNTRHHDSENIHPNHSGAYILARDFFGYPSGTLLVKRVSDKSTIWYVLPYIYFDWQSITLSFRLDGLPTGSDPTSGSSYEANVSFDNLTHYQDKQTRRGFWKTVVSSAFGVAETATFAIPGVGALVGASVQAAKGIYDAATGPAMSSMSQAVNDLTQQIQDTAEKLTINNVSSTIAMRSGSINDLMADCGTLSNDIDNGADPEQYANIFDAVWLPMFMGYSFNDTDELKRQLLDLVANQYGGEALPVYLSGVSTLSLCWRLFLLMNAWSDADNIPDNTSYTVAYLTETAGTWLKLTTRFVYETIDDRMRNQIKIDNRNLQDSYIEIAVSVSNKDNPWADLNRYLYNVFYQWTTDNSDVPGQLSDLRKTAAMWGERVAILPQGAERIGDCQTISNQVWAQPNPTDGFPAWSQHPFVRYGVKFAYLDLLDQQQTSSSDIFWSPPFTIGAYILPYLEHIPLDYYNCASSRSLWRQFGDGPADNITWQAETCIQVLADDATTTAWDQSP